MLDEVKSLASKSGSIVQITGDARLAAHEADVVYTDTWMSYGIKAAEEGERKKFLMPFQVCYLQLRLLIAQKVTQELLKLAQPSALFMHCLPATRGNEMTADVIDGTKSVVFDQAENRLRIYFFAQHYKTV